MSKRRAIPPAVPLEDLPELAQTLVRRQECLDWSDGQMAAFLGVTIDEWRRTKAGQVSMNILPGVTQAFPQLHWMVMRFLQGLESSGGAVEIHQRVAAARDAWIEEEKRAGIEGPGAYEE